MSENLTSRLSTNVRNTECLIYCVPKEGRFIAYKVCMRRVMSWQLSRSDILCIHYFRFYKRFFVLCLPNKPIYSSSNSPLLTHVGHSMYV